MLYSLCMEEVIEIDKQIFSQNDENLSLLNGKPYYLG